MTEAMIYDVLRQGLWVAVMISAPLLAVALVVGVVIGLFQALTSVQEMTLTFVPKVGGDDGGVLGVDELHDRHSGRLLHRHDHSADRRGLKWTPQDMRR